MLKASIMQSWVKEITRLRLEPDYPGLRSGVKVKANPVGTAREELVLLGDGLELLGTVHYHVPDLLVREE